MLRRYQIEEELAKIDDAERLLALGRSAFDLDFSDVAYSCFHKARDVAFQCGDELQLAQALVELSACVMHFCPEEDSDPLQLRKQFGLEAAQLFEKVNESKGLIRSLILLASSDISLASRYLKKARKLADSLGDLESAIQVSLAIAKMHALAGDFQKSQVSLTRATEDARLLGQNKFIALIQDCTSVIASWLPEKTRLDHARAAQSSYRTLYCPASLARSLLISASLNKDIGSVTNATSDILEARALFDQSGNISMVESCDELLELLV